MANINARQVLGPAGADHLPTFATLSARSGLGD
jgi:hypothetical protein